MTGTEKQIKWANEIRDCVIEILEEAIKAEPRVETVLNKIIDKLNDENTYAGDIIELFKHIPNMTKKGDVTGNLARVTSTMKTTVNKDWNLKSFM